MTDISYCFQRVQYQILLFFSLCCSNANKRNKHVNTKAFVPATIFWEMWSIFWKKRRVGHNIFGHKCISPISAWSALQFLKNCYLDSDPYVRLCAKLWRLSKDLVMNMYFQFGSNSRHELQLFELLWWPILLTKCYLLNHLYFIDFFFVSAGESRILL